MQQTSRSIAENVEACFAEESYRDKEGYERLVAMHIQYIPFKNFLATFASNPRLIEWK